MKKFTFLFFVFALLALTDATGQSTSTPRHDGVYFNPFTSATIAPTFYTSEGHVRYNSDTGTLWMYESGLMQNLFRSEKITVTPTGGYSAVDLQSALEQMRDSIDIAIGGAFDVTSNYTVTGGWNFNAASTFNARVDLLSITNINNQETYIPYQKVQLIGDGKDWFAIQQHPTTGALRFVPSTTASEEDHYTLSFTGDPVLPQDLSDKEYVDEQIATASSGAGEKIFEDVSAAKTLALSDFIPSASDTLKIKWFNVSGTGYTVSVPDLTGTSRSAVFKGEPGADVTFEATGTMQFWISGESSYTDGFTLLAGGIVSITPINSKNVYSVDGDVLGFTIDSSGPTAVTNLQESNIQTNSVRLNWDHATDDEGVSYYELSTNGVDFSDIGYVTQYDLLGLTSNTAYTITIRAVDTSGNLGATATVSFTTASTFTLVTDSNVNTNIFSSGAGSNVDNDTGLYDSGIDDHFAPVNISSQSAVATTVNGYTHAHRVVSDGSQFSRVRPKFLNTTVQGRIYEWDLLYRMTDGGQYGAINVDGTSVTGLNATDWTLVSGESTAGGTTLDVEVYASNNAAANAGEAIEWILIVKEKEGQVATLDLSTSYSYVQFNDGTYPITNVYDDDTSTFASAFGNSNEKAVILDLGTAKSIGYISLSTRNNFGTRLNDVNIQVSNDGTSWTTDSTTGTAFTGTGIETQQFNLVDQSTQYRYIRIQKPADASTVNLDLSEFRVYTF